MPTPDIFLSYSREDQPQARGIAAAFEREGFPVWWDQALAAGEAFDEVTEKALEDARAVVVLWSPRSVISRWVRAEAAQADEAGKLIPVQIEACAIPVKFKLTQTADLSGWSGDTSDPRWRALVAGLQRKLRTQGQDPLTDAASAPAHAPASAPASAAAPAPAPAPTLRPPAPTRRTPLLIAGLLALLVVAAGAAWWFGRHQQAAATATAQQLAPTIAVLPFADLSPAKDQESFSDGLTEEILNSLARITGMQVTGRTSSFHFKGRNEPLQSIGQQLGVNYLLEGSVRKQGDELRVTAQLIKSADGFHLWSRTYDRTTQDIFDIQENIARSVADVLQVALGVGDLSTDPGMTRDVAAYELYLEGLPDLSRLTLEGFQAAAAKFEAAVQRDPQFLWAWIAGWDAYLNAWTMSGNNPQVRDAMFERSSAMRAHVADNFPDNPLAREYIDRTAEVLRGDWILAAMDILQRSRTPPPGMRRAGLEDNIEASIARVRLDKASAAIPVMERLRERDPLNPAVLVYLPEAYANVGRLGDALAENDRAWKQAPSELIAANGWIMAMATKDPARIRSAWDRVLSVTQPGSLAQTLYALQGDPAALRAEIRRRAQQSAPASQLALYAAAYGEPELAVEMLRADQDMTRRVISVLALWRPVSGDMRKLPQFKDLVREWKLVDYWRQHGWGDHCKPVGDEDFECR